MSRYLRSTFLVIGASCFLAMAFGIVLQLHLAHVDDPLTHDADHCPICQQLVVSKKDCIAQIEPAAVAIDQVGQIVRFRPDTLALHTPAERFHARAPPA